MGLLDFIKKIVSPTGTHDDVDLGKLKDAILPPLLLPKERYLNTSKSVSEVPLNSKPPPITPPKPAVDDTEYIEPLRLLAEGCPLLFVQGKAGTGKTWFIQYLRTALPRKKIAVVAPTGIAALNCGGFTIHSFFRIRPQSYYEPNDAPATIADVACKALYSHLDILVIDEISMVRADLLDLVDVFLRKHGPHSGKPFGGVQVVLVGDCLQLEPIVKSHEERAIFNQLADPANPARYQSAFFFAAKAFTGTAKHVELRNVHRTQDADFISALNRIRVGDDLPIDCHVINKLCTLQPDVGMDDGVTLTCLNAPANRINQQQLSNLPSEQHTFQGDVWGSFTRVDADDLPAPLQLHLKVGAPVLFKKNDPGKRWVNGTMGRVERFESRYIHVKTETGNTVPVERVMWEKFRLRYNPVTDLYENQLAGSYTQYPLDLGWAICTHKAQGMTLRKTRIIPDGAFACGQMYVALSRTRSAKDITLSRPLTPGDIRVHPYAKNFYQSLQEDRRVEVSSAPAIPAMT